jgi:hypothetical protein
MTISFKTVLQNFSPEQLQRIKQRVADQIAEDPELQRLLVQEMVSVGDNSIDEVLREAGSVPMNDRQAVVEAVSHASIAECSPTTADRA